MRLSHIGVAIGLLALSAAVLSPWAIAALSPPAPTIEESVVDLASRIKDAAAAKIAGREYVSEANSEPSTVVRYYFPTVIGIAMLAVALGAIALIRETPKLPGAMAMGIGFTAVIVQWSVFVALLVLGLVVLFKVLDTFDVGLSLFD